MSLFDKFKSEKTLGVVEETSADQPIDVQTGLLIENADHLHRRLGNRQIQLIAIGGSIGTALFVSIGGALNKAGPGSLFLAYLIYAIMMGLVNNCMAEMAVYQPVSGGFVRMAGKWVDDAFGFMAGYNFWLYECLVIPFEITALNLVLSYWSDNIPPAAICAAVIVLYTAINLFAVKAFGETEFWLSGGKVILIILLFCFTFITMVGGNPKGDAFGFRYWDQPGSFREYLSTGALGRFEGFLAALWSASFTIVGPEYLSMVAAEAKRPRIYLRSAFKTAYIRFGLFFVGGSLACGILIPYNDPTLEGIYNGDTGGSGTATASPYVIACKNLGITVIPHIINALMVTSIFSAGNTYCYCATRSLYGLALEGRAPKVLRKCTKSGIPIYAFAITMFFPFLSFLSVSKSSGVVLNWLINLVTAGGIINFAVMCTTYIFFYRACKAQGFDRSKLPYTGWFQPYSGYIGLAWMIMVVFCYGYSSFTPWNVQDFFIYYTMLIIAPITFLGWKLVKKTKFVKPLEADLIWQAPIVDAYEETFIDPPTTFWREMLQLVGIGRKKQGNDRRRSSVIETARVTDEK